MSLCLLLLSGAIANFNESGDRVNDALVRHELALTQLTRDLAGTKAETKARLENIMREIQYLERLIREGNGCADGTAGTGGP